MTRQTPRCIVLDGHRRCRHRVARRNGDLYVCTGHGMITMALIDDGLAPTTRRMLAHERWETAAEAQRLIDRLHRRRAA
jgi:hypothetical protein